MTDMIKIEVADKHLSVPVDKKTLGEFISGLLGQSQSLERSIESAFSVDHSWLVHLCALILQRIEQQNAPEPLAFEATVNYRDGIVRKVTSLPAFKHFSETQNIVSTGIKINIAVLIQFPGKHVPERQELTIEFDTRDAQSNFVESLIGRRPTVGLIQIEIRHTERTWADDVLRLVVDELRNVQVVEGKLKKWTRNAIFPLFTFMFPVGMLGATLVESWSKRSSMKQLTFDATTALANKHEDLHSLHEKVNLLLSQAMSDRGAKLGPPIVLASSFVVAIVIFAAGILLARPNPSFVVMSKATERHKEETLEKLKRKNLIILFS